MEFQKNNYLVAAGPCGGIILHLNPLAGEPIMDLIRRQVARIQASGAACGGWVHEEVTAAG
jgi:hypothetical protein